MQMAIIILCNLIMNSSSLKIFESTVGLEDKIAISGLQYKKKSNEKVELTHSLTGCVRINFQRLDGLDVDGSSRILIIGNSNYPSRDFLRMYAKYPITWFGYGNHELGKGFKGSWPLKDPVKNNFLIWRTNVWHHICTAYTKTSSHMVDGQMISRILISRTLISDF